MIPPKPRYEKQPNLFAHSEFKPGNSGSGLKLESADPEFSERTPSEFASREPAILNGLARVVYETSSTLLCSVS
jgi:hypothetical protein